MSLEKRFGAVQDQINVTNTELLAVSKKQPVEKIKDLYSLGQRKFGESYVQESIEKIEELIDYNIEWHFIGPIQSNKTKYIAKYFDWVQSVDSIKLLTRLNNQRQGSIKLNVLLQLKVGGEDSKRGLSATELLVLAEKYAQFTNLQIRGLMSIPAPTSDISIQSSQFKYCYDVFCQMQKIIPVDTLSMGMSNDLEQALVNGTTMVRIGTDIFGKRPS